MACIDYGMHVVIREVDDERVAEIERLDAEGRIGPQTRPALGERGEAGRRTREREAGAAAVAPVRPPGAGMQP